MNHPVLEHRLDGEGGATLLLNANLIRKPVDRLGGSAETPWGIAGEGNVSRVNIPDDRAQAASYPLVV
jgi:hypothetical protein